MSKFIYSLGIIIFVSIGLALRPRRIRDYFRECVSISLIKFVLVPCSSVSIAALLGFGDLDGGLPLKVVVILSSMPVAFTALIPPSLYDLDLDLANSCWLFTTSLLMVTLPLLLLITSVL